MLETAISPQQAFSSIQSWEHWDEIGKVAAKEYGMSAERYQQLLPEYQKFLSLVIGGNRGLGMFNAEIDQIWHSHILSTLRYDEFCQRYHGEMIHHLPQLTPKSKNQCTTCQSCRDCSIRCEQPTSSSDANTYEGFQRAYVSAFGILSPFWNLPEADGIAN